MDQLPGYLPHVPVYFDAILVTGSDDDEHWSNASQVLQRHQDAGLRPKLAMCGFIQDRVEYQGHVIMAEDLHPSPRNVKATLSAPRLQDVKKLQGYVGLINFDRKFIPRLTAVLNPGLLIPGIPWTSSRQGEAFDESKKLLAAAETLAHFDPKENAVQVTDASPYNLGADLAQREA